MLQICEGEAADNLAQLQLPRPTVGVRTSAARHSWWCGLNRVLARVQWSFDSDAPRETPGYHGFAKPCLSLALHDSSSVHSAYLSACQNYCIHQIFSVVVLISGSCSCSRCIVSSFGSCIDVVIVVVVAVAQLLH